MNNEAEQPLVTIAIPNYNTGAYICEAIESALSQTFQDIEILIVDNASTDNSRNIIRDRTQGNSRVIVQHYDTLVNSLDNWNRCLKHARGKYIVFLHADDRLKPEFVEAALRVYAHQPDLGYVLAEYETINKDGKVVDSQQFYNASAIIPGLSEARVSFMGWHTVPVQMLIRTECMRAIGGYQFSDIMAPLMLNMRWDVGYLHTPLVQYRQHEQTITSLVTRDKTLVMAMYITKVLVLDHYLPPKGAYLKELKEKVMQKTAHNCLTLYCMDMLGRNEKRLCQEYMALAQGFWLDIDQTPIYHFLKEALKKNEWTAQGLKEKWDRVRPIRVSAAPPYPLPEGSVIISSNS